MHGHEGSNNFNKDPKLCSKTRLWTGYHAGCLARGFIQPDFNVASKLKGTSGMPDQKMPG